MEQFTQLQENRPYRAHLQQLDIQLLRLSGFMEARELSDDYDPNSYRALDEVNKSFSAINKTEKLIIDEIKAIEKKINEKPKEDPFAKL